LIEFWLLKIFLKHLKVDTSAHNFLISLFGYIYSQPNKKGPEPQPGEAKVLLLNKLEIT
jgi:hypothetical protein